MAILEALIGPIASIIDKVIPDKAARDKAKLELLATAGNAGTAADQRAAFRHRRRGQFERPWTSRARPSFLYVIYVLLLWALPMGILAAFRPGMAQRDRRPG